jgi:hypothetical protein
MVDSATDAAIKESTLRDVTVDLGTLSTDSLRQLFRHNRGRVILLLGHVEGENFVAKDATGRTTLLDVPLAEVETMAEAHGCDVVFLGCNSARAETPVGVSQAFNPVDAVGRLVKALGARNYEEFAHRLTGADMSLVFSEAAFIRTKGKAVADAYANDTTTPEGRFRASNRVGKLLLVLGLAAAAGSGGTGETGSEGPGTGGSGGPGAEGFDPGGTGAGGSRGAGADGTGHSDSGPATANRTPARASDAAYAATGGMVLIIMVVLMLLVLKKVW